MPRSKPLPKKIRHMLCLCSLNGKHYTHAMEEVKKYCESQSMAVPEVKEAYYVRIKGYLKHWLRHPSGPEQAILEHAYVKTRSYKGTKDWIDSLNSNQDIL